MKKCIFCAIANKDVDESERIIYSDEFYVAMKVMHPESLGHFIVFPTVHASEMKELNNYGQFFEKVIKLAEEWVKKLYADAYILKLNNNLYKIEDDVRHVGHVHMHVIPRYKTIK